MIMRGLRLAGMSTDCREVQGHYVDPTNFPYAFGKNGVAMGRAGQMGASYALPSLPYWADKLGGDDRPAEEFKK
jgi:hypothetical protein